MSERDELAHILSEWLDDEAPLHLRRYKTLADHLLKLGYRKVEPCPTCSGPIRETVDMRCQACGRDFMEDA